MSKVEIYRYRPNNDLKTFEANRLRLKIDSTIDLIDNKDKKMNILQTTFGNSNEAFFKRLFRPSSECNLLTSRLVNIFIFIKC